MAFKWTESEYDSERGCSYHFYKDDDAWDRTRTVCGPPGRAYHLEGEIGHVEINGPCAIVCEKNYEDEKRYEVRVCSDPSDGDSYGPDFMDMYTGTDCFDTRQEAIQWCEDFMPWLGPLLSVSYREVPPKYKTSLGHEPRMIDETFKDDQGRECRRYTLDRIVGTYKVPDLVYFRIYDRQARKEFTQMDWCNGFGRPSVALESVRDYLATTTVQEFQLDIVGAILDGDL